MRQAARLFRSNTAHVACSRFAAGAPNLAAHTGGLAVQGTSVGPCVPARRLGHGYGSDVAEFSSSALVQSVQHDESTRREPIGPIVAASLDKDAVVNDTRNARAIVEQLTSDHRRQLMVEILTQEYGRRGLQPGQAGSLSGFWFARHDSDADGSLTRKEFEKAVEDVMAWTLAATKDPTEELNPSSWAMPSRRTLLQVALAGFVPFMGFGFIDNFMMILAGEAIEMQLGVAFGLSTMAAAALGNLFSDVIGLMTSGGIEAGASKIGCDEPTLSAWQRRLTRVKVFRYAGSILGLVVGCIAGMVPLLFVRHDNKSTRDATEQKLTQRVAELEARLAAGEGGNQPAAA